VASIEGQALQEDFPGVFRYFVRTVDSLIQYQWEPAYLSVCTANVNRFRGFRVSTSRSSWSFQPATACPGEPCSERGQTLEGEQFVDAFYVPKLKWRTDLMAACSGNYL